MRPTEIASRLEMLAKDVRGVVSSHTEVARRIFKQQVSLNVREEIPIYSPVLGDPEYRRFVERDIAAKFAHEMVKGQHFSVERQDPYHGAGCYGNVRLDAKMYCFTEDRLRALIDEAVTAGRFS